MWPLRLRDAARPLDSRAGLDDPARLFLYDHLARREVLPGSRVSTCAGTRPARHCSPFHRGFVYSDGWVDDARLVVLNAIDARARAQRC
jgi:glycerol-3-phosphate dehydrogenase